MFCRNCGKELTGNPENCPECGAKPMSGTSFCPNCGAPTTPLTEICPKCGARVAGKVGGAWQPLTAGILDLVAGVPALIIGILIAAGLGVLGRFLGGLSGIAGLGILTGAISVPLIIFAIVAIVGGVFALRKRVWGLALAGSIFALFCVWFLGIPAIVFTVIGRRHFR
jgi:RNA polymerase subunit RPABC4/transcription elongation factor Spt4